MPNSTSTPTPIALSAAEIADIEGEAFSQEPNGERPPLGLQPNDSELLNKATDPQINPDADPYDDREAQL